MKTIIALATALLMGSAFAQSNTHMFEFNADSVLNGVISFDKTKTKGAPADNDTQLDLDLNYAYALASMPRLQLGSRLAYGKGTASGRGDFEDYGLQVGAIINHIPDLQNALYASLYIGMNWANTYTGGNSHDENWVTTVAVGKRYAMDRFGIKHLTYSPEVALQNMNSTTGSTVEYSQNIQFRFLQFSVFF